MRAQGNPCRCDRPEMSERFAAKDIERRWRVKKQNAKISLVLRCIATGDSAMRVVVRDTPALHFFSRHSRRSEIALIIFVTIQPRIEKRD